MPEQVATTPGAAPARGAAPVSGPDITPRRDSARGAAIPTRPAPGRPPRAGTTPPGRRNPYDAAAEPGLGVGGVAVTSVGTAVGAGLLDVAARDRLGLFFAACFVVGCFGVAAAARPAAAFYGAVVPPLALVAALAAAAPLTRHAVGPGTAAGRLSVPRAVLTGLGEHVVLLAIGTAIAVLTVAVRAGVSGRAGRPR